MIIRPADEGDLEALLAIEEACFGNERFSRDVVRSFVLREDSFTAVALEGDRILGSAMCTMPRGSRAGRIISIAVLEQSRRAGVGSRLLEECERMLRENGRRRVTLEVEVSNRPAISLYSKHGYQVTGRIRQYYSDDRDAFVMEKRI
jgi:ribosomal-protein-alanine acetyltransferase